jgi:hypothetical protein
VFLENRIFFILVQQEEEFGKLKMEGEHGTTYQMGFLAGLLELLK